MANFDDNAVVLKHGLGTRLFHWGLVLGFLPAAFTGIALWLRPFGDAGMHMTMQIHIVGAWILSLACVYFSCSSINALYRFGGKSSLGRKMMLNG